MIAGAFTGLAARPRALSDENSILLVRTPFDATFNNSAVAINVHPAAGSVWVDFIVSDGATWALYKDSQLIDKLEDNVIRDLNFGANVSYMVVTAENGNTRTYAVSVNRPENQIRKIKAIISPSNFQIMDNEIYCVVDNSVAYLNVEIYVPNAQRKVLFQR